MADIYQGQHADLILGPNDVLRVSASGSATVRSVFGAPAGTVTVNGGWQDFGPYGVAAKVDVTAVSGGATYRMLDPVALTADEVAKAKALVSGGGNIRQRLGGPLALPTSSIRCADNFPDSDGNTGTGKTFALKVAGPKGYDAIQFLLLNHLNADATGILIAASTAASAAELYNNGGTWADGTIKGVSPGMQAGVGGTNAQPIPTWCDPIAPIIVPRSDDDYRNLWFTRYYTPTGNTNIPVLRSNLPSPTVLTAVGQEWIPSVQGGNFVTTKTGYTAAGVGLGHAIAAVRFLGAKPTVTLADCGDSTSAGYASTPTGNTAAQIAVAARSPLTQVPITSHVLARSAVTLANHIVNVEWLIPFLKPTGAVWQVASPNDPRPTAAQVQLWRSYIFRFLKLCSENGVVPFLKTSPPSANNASNAASLYSVAQSDLLLDLNEEVRALCAAGSAVLIDQNLILGDTQTRGVAQKWKAGVFADDLHPNLAGYQLLADTPVVGYSAALNSVFG